MTLVGRESPMRQDFQHQENETKEYANSLLQKDSPSTEEMTNMKNKLHTLERKAALYNAVVDTIHRIMMDIIRNMSR